MCASKKAVIFLVAVLPVLNSTVTSASSEWSLSEIVRPGRLPVIVARVLWPDGTAIGNWVRSTWTSPGPLIQEIWPCGPIHNPPFRVTSMRTNEQSFVPLALPTSTVQISGVILPSENPNQILTLSNVGFARLGRMFLTLLAPSSNQKARAKIEPTVQRTFIQDNPSNTSQSSYMFKLYRFGFWAVIILSLINMILEVLVRIKKYRESKQ